VRKPVAFERKSPLEFDLIVFALGAFGFTLTIKQCNPEAALSTLRSSMVMLRVYHKNEAK